MFIDGSQNTQRTLHTKYYNILFCYSRLTIFLQRFIPKLKNHLLSRVDPSLQGVSDREFTGAERQQLHIVKNRIYHHKALRINYTTYDCRRDQDTINPRAHADVMMLSDEDGEENPHPYWYARVIGIFHFYVLPNSPTPRTPLPVKIDVLWVRWFGRNLCFKSGWAAKRLHQIGFLKHDSPDGAFGFVDPEYIIRGAHLIPGFHYGQTTDLLGPSDIRQPSENGQDWAYFYVNM